MAERRPLKDYEEPIGFRLRTPEEIAEGERWNKILSRYKSCRLTPEHTIGNVLDIGNSEDENNRNNRKKAPSLEELDGGNGWRAGENAAERHLISRVELQTKIPVWANSREAVMRVLQARFPLVDWNNGHFKNSLAARWSGAIYLCWRECVPSTVAAKELGMRAGTLRKFLLRVREYGEKVLNS